MKLFVSILFLFVLGKLFAFFTWKIKFAAIKNVPWDPRFISLSGLVISDEKHLLDIQTLTKQFLSVKEPINNNSTAVQNISNNLICYRCFSFQKWCADEDSLKMIGKAAIMEDCAQCFYIFGSKNYMLNIEWPERISKEQYEVLAVDLISWFHFRTWRKASSYPWLRTNTLNLKMVVLKQ